MQLKLRDVYNTFEIKEQQNILQQKEYELER